MNILIADDDAICRMTLAAALKRLGHDVTAIARDGQEALDLYERGGQRVVISDLLMPTMDGLELCRRIRNTPTPNTPTLSS